MVFNENKKYEIEINSLKNKITNLENTDITLHKELNNNISELKILNDELNLKISTLENEKSN